MYFIILLLCLFSNTILFALVPNLWNGAMLAFVAFMVLLVTLSPR